MRGFAGTCRLSGTGLGCIKMGLGEVGRGLGEQGLQRDKREDWGDLGSQD